MIKLVSACQSVHAPSLVFGHFLELPRGLMGMDLRRQRHRSELLKRQLLIKMVIGGYLVGLIGESALALAQAWVAAWRLALKERIQILRLAH